MAVPICLSQYFVNKQNVRSFGNLIKIKKEESLFLCNIFEDEHKTLVSLLPNEFIQMLLELKSKLKENSRTDFRYFFPITGSAENLKAVDKKNVFETCSKVLYEIIPNKLFGCQNNSKIFNNLVKTAIYSMKGQNMIFENFLETWDHSKFPWNTFTIEKSIILVMRLLLWIIKYILSPMICLNFYVTTCKMDIDDNKLFYFRKHQWQSYYDKKISNLVIAKVIKKNIAYSLGKRVKKNHSMANRLVMKNMKKEIPKLHFVLKPNNDCRPIVRYRSEVTPQEKYRIKDTLNFLKKLTGNKTEKIEAQFSNLSKNWKILNKPKLYFVKADLSNAFGAILKEKLIKMLCERHLNFQKVEKNVNIKKKVAQQFKSMLDELRKPLLVRAGSTVFEWKQGLVQGYKYSPALSELYYTCLDEIYFSHFLKNSSSNIKLFGRVVDDYLYVTDSINSALEFVEALSNYRNVNWNKTVVNFEHPSINFSDEIIFLGYSYNTKNLEVSRANNVYVGQMCYKIAFTDAIIDTHKFLESRIGQSGIQINGHIFNFHYNSEELTWSHIFTTYCLSANKFCTILSILCNQTDTQGYLQLYKKRVVVKLTSQVIETLNRNKPKDYLFVYCINHFRYLAWKALYLCARNTSKCRTLVPLVKDEIAKTNCIFGKWREHSRRIELSGEMGKKAVREICKRTDLKEIMKAFETLPLGFRCFDRKLLS